MPEPSPTMSRFLLVIGTSFAVLAFILRLAVVTPIEFIHNALVPWEILELPFIFFGALIWTFIMSKGRPLFSTVFAGLVTLGYWIVTTGIGFV